MSTVLRGAAWLVLPKSAQMRVCIIVCSHDVRTVKVTLSFPFPPTQREVHGPPLHLHPPELSPLHRRSSLCVRLRVYVTWAHAVTVYL